ncbi:hypothetical protein CWI42_080420 [Ordospora colligata]|uniref:Uncharacterized protein n=1 Tax=Ordospora colligata OC4 TaxID=1354746 RepID=A0A0B2UJ12_9MICR|nr:uncharacterized protein M896_080420 [Ordospora colligata OC4]KHN69308.1 hypothetical protein M896_080420 [Ordospora colligata OC4]TBU15124.1 hypothetical protein CWI41_080430 [Ordospora colligata]TBU15175.1 hypothetical protein CWI40_080430 [Ordospora colligata]TBU18421.1 hypothetical protein CWI42_080420 [Ordospora colligata]
MESSQDSVLKAVDAVEEKTNYAVDVIGNSSIGNYIPLEVKYLSLYEMTEYSMFFTILEIIPVYLMAHADGKSTFTHIMGTIFIIIAMLSIGLSLAAFYTKMFELYKYVVIMSMTKVLIASIIVIFLNLSDWYIVILALIYALKIVGFEGLFLYYLAILFRRSQSDEYDDRGEKIKIEERAMEEV